MASMPPPPNQPPLPPSGPPSGSPAAPAGYQQPYAAPYPAAQPYGYTPGGHLPIRRNAMLILAQVLVIIQGILGLLLGVLFILLGVAANSLFSGLNLHNVNGYNIANAATGVFIGVGVVLIILFLFVIIGGVRVGRPSQIARWLLAAFEILLLLGSIESLARGTNNGVAGSIVAIVIEALILYGLIIDPATYRAFARKNLPQPGRP